MKARVINKIPLSLVSSDLPPEKDIESVEIKDGHLIITALTEVPDDEGPIILTEEEYLQQKRDGTLYSKRK